MPQDPITLELTAQFADGLLQVSYSLVNASAQAIVVYDGDPGVIGSKGRDLTGRCYISYGGHGVARILRIRPPAHPTMDTTRAFIPPGSEVRQGDTRKVRFHLPEPIRERSEFSPDFAGARYEKKPVTQLALEVGYFWKTAETVLKPLLDPNVFHVVKGAPLSDTRVVSASTAVNIDLMVRTDSSFIRM